jgi:hypothetical protein
MESRTFESGQALAIPSGRAAHCASLSVILLSQGDRTDLERALGSISGHCRRLEAEIIVVRSAMGDDARLLNAAYPSVKFLDAPAECSNGEMRSLGMDHAGGDIVALRDDAAVGDGAWLGVFDITVGVIEELRTTEMEVLMTAISDDDAAMFERDRRKARSLATPSSMGGSRRDRRSDPFHAPHSAPLELDGNGSSPQRHEI